MQRLAIAHPVTISVYWAGDVDVLGGLEASHVIAMGESQSAARMVTMPCTRSSRSTTAS